MISAQKLKNMYDKGMNISEILREDMGLDHNTKEIIETSYDLQTGSYIDLMRDNKTANLKEKYSEEIANEILLLCNPKNILEAGVGEATTLSGVVKALKNIPNYGFDLSWSRISYAQKWLDENHVENSQLCTGDLFDMPFLDNSIDVVYTSHSIEPNGGSEERILSELYRVTNKFLILLEPGYELANDDARKRMDSHGYCKNLELISKKLGYDVLKHELFPHSANSLNPTAITVISKGYDKNSSLPSNPFACPQYKTPLKKVDGMLYSGEALAVYPIIGGIPCLRAENSILASKYEEVSKINIRRKS